MDTQLFIVSTNKLSLDSTVLLFHWLSTQHPPRRTYHITGQTFFMPCSYQPVPFVIRHRGTTASTARSSLNLQPPAFCFRTGSITIARRCMPLVYWILGGAFYVHVTVYLNKFLYNKTNRRTNFPNLFCQRNSTYFGQFVCAHHQEFFTVHSALVYVMQVWWQLESLKALIKPAWHIPVPNVQWKNSWWWAQTNCPKYVEFLWQNKFGKIVRLLVLLQRNRWGTVLSQKNSTRCKFIYSVITEVSKQRVSPTFRV
jgi:hypothetical protein